MSGGFSPEHASQIRRAAGIASGHAASDDLAGVLYGSWYAAPVGPARPPRTDGAPLAGVLREAHAGAHRWTPGGPVVRTGRAGVVVTRLAGEAPRAVTAGDYVHADPRRTGIEPVVGDHLLLRERRGCVVGEGWWRTWGRDGGRICAPAGITRVYLAADPERLSGLIGALTRVLMASTRDWMLKCAVEAATLARPDALVVYLPDDAIGDDGEPGDLLERLAVAVRGRLRRGHPPMSAALDEGMSWSRDPGDGSSFGEARCAVVAAGLREPSGRDPVEAVARAFRAAGLDPARPHLRAAGSDGP